MLSLDSRTLDPCVSPEEWWECLSQAEAFPLAGWIDHHEVNCVAGQGATPIPGVPEPFHRGFHPLDCLRACEEIAACQAAILLESYDPSPCYLRTQVDVSKCFAAPGYSLWVKPGALTTSTVPTTAPTTTAKATSKPVTSTTTTAATAAAPKTTKATAATATTSATSTNTTAILSPLPPLPRLPPATAHA
ncbi:C42C1.13 [Symbiodinium natans]|uniref:C42C1.13 protein n=1 Tax=Symbiodinium natans TaxID=878477 RepID=A0A812P4S4_9DINO|nr:C42C1.13 [Symbiodinium natans]